MAVRFVNGRMVCRACERHYSDAELMRDDGSCLSCLPLCSRCEEPLPEGVEGSVCMDCRQVFAAMRRQVDVPEGPADPRVTAFHDGQVKRDLDQGQLDRERTVDGILERMSSAAVGNGRQPHTGQRASFCPTCYIELPRSGVCGNCDE